MRILKLWAIFGKFWKMQRFRSFHNLRKVCVQFFSSISQKLLKKESPPKKLFHPTIFSSIAQKLFKKYRLRIEVFLGSPSRLRKKSLPLCLFWLFFGSLTIERGNISIWYKKIILNLIWFELCKASRHEVYIIEWFNQIGVAYFWSWWGVLRIFLSKNYEESVKNQNFRKNFFERSRSGK